MRLTKTIITIIALATVAIMIAIVSCKKETENALDFKTNDTQRTIKNSQIEDVNAYLNDFRQKLMESKSNETMNLEDAAWHLACLANIDFCKVNVEYNDFKFDTIEMMVKTTDGSMLINDIRLAYEQMCSEINNFKKRFRHSNENLFFINMFINSNGKAIITIKSTFISTPKGLDEHLWYFPDTFCYLDSVCEANFTSDSTYLWNGTARRELQRILNLFENHQSHLGVSNYLPTRSYTFEYPYWQDPYGSPFMNNSRIFAGDVCVGGTFILSPEEMCYCLDSYLGLVYDYIDNNYYCEDECPVNWVVQDSIRQFGEHKCPTHYHRLIVQYGRPNKVTPQPDPN